MFYSKKLIVSLLMVILISITLSLYYSGVFAPHLFLTKQTFDQLPSWRQDDHAQALIAFKKSCVDILKRKSSALFSSLPQAGQVEDWQSICLSAAKIDKTDNLTARRFFETWFQPYAVKNNFRSYGLFTGYYLPLLQGSFTQNDRYSVPIYGMPRDLVRINLGTFYTELSGKMITGQLKNNRLVPYPDRSAITKGAINHSTPILLWGDNAIDIFFAQIQGSAIAQLPSGEQVLLGYAGSNGHPYTTIGKVMIEKNLLNRESVSMQSIKAWLVAHPEQIDSILNYNASYVFFQLLKTKDPIGTEQVPLTSRRSLAVDTRYIPLGAPIWLDTQVPQNQLETSVPYQHLLIAQDTGGNVKGIIRGDVYWGAGDEAAFIAGHMNSKGRYWILLPRVRKT